MDLPVGESYEDICRKFSWQIPEYFNIADAVCDRWADDTTRIAMTHENLDGSVKNFTFAEIKRYSNQFANLLNSLGLEQGDRALVLLTQSPECAISHVACFKSGIVSCLASVLFGPDAIQHRLTSTNAKVCITNKANLSKVQNIRGACPSLEHIVVVDDDSPSHALSLWRSIADQNDTFDNVKTLSEDTAWISFTSGTTGQPKGVLMPHRILLGNKPLFEYYYDYGPREGDTLWSPADWAWIAGLINILLVGWYSGCRVVSTDMEGFNAEAAFRILGQHDITVSLLTPTVLKLMRQIDSEESPELQLRVVLSGGEAVGKELALWADDRFGLTISEGFGQTECNGMIGTNPRLMAVRHGSLGKAMPGSVCATWKLNHELFDKRGNVVVTYYLTFPLLNTKDLLWYFHFHVVLHLHLTSKTPVICNFLAVEEPGLCWKNLATTLGHLTLTHPTGTTTTTGRGQEDFLVAQCREQCSTAFYLYLITVDVQFYWTTWGEARFCL